MPKCRSCAAEYVRLRPLQAVCGPACAVVEAKRRTELQRVKESRQERVRDRAALADLKSRQDWLREAQAAVNRFIRVRDADLPCISCGRNHKGQNHAGHYLSVGARPELRFEPFNIAKQCAPCNTYKAGNVAAYRVGLIERIGLERVEWLEGPHEARKYTIDDMKALKAEYSRKARELEKQRND